MLDGVANETHGDCNREHDLGEVPLDDLNSKLPHRIKLRSCRSYFLKRLNRVPRVKIFKWLIING